MLDRRTPDRHPPRPRPRRSAKPDRPAIGLALGGGVARGWCHIGVVRTLVKAGYVPDIVCGTSIGALVGGLYLADRLDVLEDWARGLTKRRMVSYLDILPGGAGLLGGKRLRTLIESHISGVRIEDLPRPFAAVAGELATGHEIWLQDGLLSEAIQASYALPGIFPPVARDGRLLIDGALVNPVPISVARALGARVVIGVALNADTFGKTAPSAEASIDPTEATVASDAFGRMMTRARNPHRPSLRQLFGADGGKPALTTVMLGALNIVMDRLSRSRMAGDPPDVLITPRCGHVSLVDFDRADECIRLGEEATEQVLPYLDEVMTVLGS